MSGGAGQGWLLLGVGLSLAAALVHLAAIVGGPAWYRALGAGEPMARAAAAGRLAPTLITLAIAAVLTLFAIFAWSAAGLLPRLPLLRVGLGAITLVYLARGAVLFAPGLLRRPDLSRSFLLWSSAIVLALGLIHLVGAWRAWPILSGEH